MLNYVYKMRRDRACHTPSIEVIRIEKCTKIHLNAGISLRIPCFGPSDQQGVFQ